MAADAGQRGLVQAAWKSFVNCLRDHVRRHQFPIPRVGLKNGRDGGSQQRISSSRTKQSKHRLSEVVVVPEITQRAKQHESLVSDHTTPAAS